MTDHHKTAQPLETLQAFAAACGGTLMNGMSAQAFVQRPFAGVCTDSRQLRAGQVFFALRGDRFDGHAFVGDAIAKGAAVVVMERNRPVQSCASSGVHAHGFGTAFWATDDPSRVQTVVIMVDDSRKALGYLATQHRKSFPLPVIAVAGSNGKTTTKELIASVLRQKLRTVWSEASFNNDIGVPLTLLKVSQTHQAAVLEVGTNHPGELEALLRIARPQYGVLTNIGREHLEFFGDLAGVAKEEGTLAEMLPPNGKLFIVGDNPWTEAIAERAFASVVKVGFRTCNDWRLSNVRCEKDGVTFSVEAPRAAFSGEYHIGLLGRHQAMNAVLAIAMGVEMGLDPESIRRGLAACEPAKMRLQSWELNGVRVLDDAYNANADSVLAALQTLIELPCKGRRVAVLGEMAELGAQSEAAHEEVGRRAAEMGVGQLFTVGAMRQVMGRGARAAGLNRV
ncbi:MAG: hypothetical protein C5B50_12165, partial [Verrucomicrobia bacterium]